VATKKIGEETLCFVILPHRDEQPWRAEASELLCSQPSPVLFFESGAAKRRWGISLLTSRLAGRLAKW